MPHVFVGRGFVIAVRHGGAPDLSAVRSRMEGSPELLKRGPEAVLYAILGAVVDGYAPVVAGVQNDIDETGTEVFGGGPRADNGTRGQLPAGPQNILTVNATPVNQRQHAEMPALAEVCRNRTGLSAAPARSARSG